MRRQSRRGARAEFVDILAHQSGPVNPAYSRPARPNGPARGRGNRRRVPLMVSINERLRWLRNWLIFILLVELGWLAFNSPVLVVKKVTVSGATVRTPLEIARLAQLTRPGNIFRVRTRRAVKLVSALPEVSSVRVERQLPDTLSVVIRERVPVASVVTPGGLWEMDGTGYVFRALSAPLPKVPRMIVRPSGVVSVGKPLPMVALPAALKCLNAMPKLPISRQAEFHIEDNGAAWLLHDNGLKIRLGQLDDAPDRMPLTERILTGPDGPDILSKLLVLDVSSPGNEYNIRRPEYEGFRFSEVGNR